MPHRPSLLKDRDQLLVNLGFGHFNVLHAHMGAPTVIPGATDIFHILVCQCPTLTVILTNGALTYQDEKQGTYEESATVNGKTSWISTDNNMAIWYVPQFKEWAIGSALEIGTNWRGISSTGASEWDCPHLVPSSPEMGLFWGYFNDAGWVTANFGDISVQCNMDSEGSESKIINNNSNLNPLKLLFSNFL